MVDFRYTKLKGLAALKTEHKNYRAVQGRYFIPREFCMPKQFFREVQVDRNVVYWKRCCSMLDFMCCMDTPFFKDKKMPDKRETKAIEPMDGPRKRDPHDIAPNAVEDKPFIRVRNIGVVAIHPARNTQQPQRQESVKQLHRQDTVPIPSSNPSRLDEEQIESAEKAENHRRAPKRNASIPESDDEINTDGETNKLFESKLLPEQKTKISKLLQEMRRIKQKNYSRG